MKSEKLNNFNFKYLALGLLLALCLIIAIGAASNDGRGRYLCCPAGDNELAVYVIDTRTGQTWRMSRTDTFDFGTPQQRKSERRSQTPITK
ncbi:MAG: hypothetical protein JSV82_06660 [Planctomycetota bacterium]|nr:MAG: hypothetical protein JSV82_06660 [Planctomycetota bacterium]